MTLAGAGSSFPGVPGGLDRFLNFALVVRYGGRKLHAHARLGHANRGAIAGILKSGMLVERDARTVSMVVQSRANKCAIYGA
jgi:hypothetical protein